MKFSPIQVSTKKRWGLGQFPCKYYFQKSFQVKNWNKISSNTQAIIQQAFPRNLQCPLQVMSVTVLLKSLHSKIIFFFNAAWTCNSIVSLILFKKSFKHSS
jgi:hypothetical protein